LNLWAALSKGELSVKQIRKRLTYANIMSSIAVFLVLGGATAIAAGLAKNSVGSKQLKKNAVTAAKIKKNAVTGAKIKKGVVTGAKVKDGSLTGSDINLGTLGTVPSAETANTANSAGKAAKTDQIVNIFFRGSEGGAPQTILNVGGLNVTATCDSGTNEIDATTSVAHSIIGVVTAQDNDYEANIDFNPGETFDLDEGHSEGPTEMYNAQYTTPGGTNVVIIWHDLDASEGPAFPGTPEQSDCLVAGLAYVS
jgi:hypothetical protein